MYHPYFRGKQYELMTVREMAPVLAASHFRPIIEPVRGAFSGLEKALDAIVKAGGRAIVVINPQYGELSNAGATVTHFLEDQFLDLPGISAGILLKPGVTPETAVKYYQAHEAHDPAFIHAGFTEAKALAKKLGSPPSEGPCHIFVERHCGKLYQKHFKGAHRVLLRDGFERRARNADYDLIERFSDLHATFRDESMDGFGDYLIVGDDYTESGGPAYAVAIHLTFIDPDLDDAMQIYHFLSVRQDTPTDPAGKFGEALAEMIETLNKPGSKVLESVAVREFRALHRQGHFPGLGYVKKLSMNHHIETLADYVQSAA
jgi:hypothetical protein